MLIELRVVLFAIPSRRNPFLARLLFYSVAGRRPVVRKGVKAGKKPLATAMGHYFKPKLSQNLKNSCGFQRHPIKYIFRHVVAEFGLHLTNFCREKPS